MPAYENKDTQNEFQNFPQPTNPGLPPTLISAFVAKKFYGNNSGIFRTANQIFGSSANLNRPRTVSGAALEIPSQFYGGPHSITTVCKVADHKILCWITVNAQQILHWIRHLLDFPPVLMIG